MADRPEVHIDRRNPDATQQPPRYELLLTPADPGGSDSLNEMEDLARELLERLKPYSSDAAVVREDEAPKRIRFSADIAHLGKWDLAACIREAQLTLERRRLD